MTLNGFRIYLTFDLTTGRTPSGTELERSGLEGDLLILERFSSSWKVADVMRFPNDDAVLSPNFINSALNNTFKIHTLNAYKEEMYLD